MFKEFEQIGEIQSLPQIPSEKIKFLVEKEVSINSNDLNTCTGVKTERTGKILIIMIIIPFRKRRSKKIEARSKRKRLFMLEMLEVLFILRGHIRPPQEKTQCDHQGTED